MKIAAVRFIAGWNKKLYHFYTDIDLNAGDIVVTDTVCGLQLAKVENMVDSVDSIGFTPTKWIVDKVDLSKHEQRKQREERLCELKAALKKRAKELEKDFLYQMLAEKDATMRELLNEYQTLQENAQGWVGVGVIKITQKNCHVDVLDVENMVLYQSTIKELLND